MSAGDLRQLYHRWLEMWNGNLALAQEIIAPDCVVHQAPFGPGQHQEFRGPEGLMLMVNMGRAAFSELTFSIEVEPIVEGNRLAARWTSRGVYNGGIPGATAPAGTQVTFSGIDIWRVDDSGRIAEYWVSSDGAHLMAQLGML